jgi:hypothetical protein
MKRDKWQPTATSMLCSTHFTDDCFRNYHSQVRIKEDAVPSIFAFPPHLQTTVKSTRRPLNRAAVQSATSTSSSSCIAIHNDTAQPTDHLQEAAIMPSVASVHSYACTVSPRGIKRKYETLLAQQRMQQMTIRKKLKFARQTIRRQQKKLTTMADVIHSLKLRPDLNSTCVDIIERSFGHIPAEMLRRKLANQSTEPYNEDIRSFALTLHFYSPKAYDFLRSSFSKALPHPCTLRNWCSAVGGKPGFTHEAFEVSNVP